MRLSLCSMRNVAVPLRGIVLALGLTLVLSGTAKSDDGFVSLFDGKSLAGWDANPEFWTVKDGAIVGQTTAEHPVKGNTFCIWRQGEVDDFELKLDYKLEGGNSGIQYRSFEKPDEWGRWVVGGYQADFDDNNTYTGLLYAEKDRGILVKRGEKGVIKADHKGHVVGSVGDPDELASTIKKGDWNTYHVIVKGYTFIHKINGRVMVEALDEDEAGRRRTGLLALQLHAGPPMKVQFKNILLKRLEMADKKKVVFVAGSPSHGPGDHEFNAGSRILASALTESDPNLHAVVYHYGWPKDPTAFDNADTIVVYADGSNGHPLLKDKDKIDQLMKKGVGLVCLHYAVEVPKDQAGSDFLRWLGGYFENYYSVNPHWKATFASLPDHPVTRGVKPFTLEDEWYYNMRFPDAMQGVTPILTALPPEATRERDWGKLRGGNPHVMARRGMPEHVAWAYERPEGGRAFGFTGGHFHKNWSDESFRKIVLNAIAWTAGSEIPPEGVVSKPVTAAQLALNLDPKGERKEAPVRLVSETSKPKKVTSTGARKPNFAATKVTAAAPGHRVPIDIDISNGKELYLVALDAGDGFGCDWVDWVNPRFVGPSGELKLTDMKWSLAHSGWGEVRIDRNCEGGPLSVDGKKIDNGLGAHANSVIVYEIPAGYTRFKAEAALDDGGTRQNDGKSTSVDFLVFDRRPDNALLAKASGAAQTRDASTALDGMEVAPGVEATLFASEPLMLNPSSIDIDHLGRVWVCEIVNYRGNSGKRPEGDRILVLEDTDHDGVADKETVFYQGNDLNGAMGVCVLGNKVIVSSSPNVFLFTDEDGDLKADKKEVLFTKTGQQQHDHSAHAFTFGPDGKLYWNFGNTGMAVHDKDGKPVVDKAGNPVIDNGKPYIGGMVFRCNPNGSDFEVLAHNFRNNYETAVDSFGTLWQSDNDDDGNRSVRINYVMEGGNFGYKDQMNGAGWAAPYTNAPKDIPSKHWHQTDPGVVPNLLITGAGSPTGILTYEGRLLPKEFWDQVIHTDAGPNVARAYPVQAEGAGYKAEIKDLLKGTQDQWFRPSDLCVAPDGSLFVADWYDPGVGGHRMADLDHGRLFRLAPPGSDYQVPKFDFGTPEGAVKALENPNLEARYLAYTALREMGAKAEPALAKLFETSDNPRFRARALWLLASLPEGTKYIDQALASDNADLRLTALRVARERDDQVLARVAKVVNDPSPAVRREAALVMRGMKGPEAAKLWAQLAKQHDGQDRWYVEALGVSADGDWDERLAAWQELTGSDLRSPAARDVVWRSRAQATPALLAQIVRDGSVPLNELPRYMRAFDFQPKEQAGAALMELAFAPPSQDAERDRIVVSEAMSRVPDFDAAQFPERAACVCRLVDVMDDKDAAVGLIRRFKVRDRQPLLLEIAEQYSSDSAGINAAKTLLDLDAVEGVAAVLSGQDGDKALTLTKALGNTSDGRMVKILMPVIDNKECSRELRAQAVRSLTRTRPGAVAVLKKVKDGSLDPQLEFAAGAGLSAAPWNDIRKEAETYFPPPVSKNNKPLPAIPQLLKMKGNAANGAVMFETSGGCVKCHEVNGKGKQVGPALSEIGSKLSRDATFEAILFPSAGISHNYESHVLALADGNIITGIVVSETDDAITVKTAEAQVLTIDRDDIDEMAKSKLSLMPQDVQKNLTAEELVDLVEYLSTLKKAQQ